METAQLVAIFTVIVVWAVAVYTIRRWGPGYMRRSVRCPDKGVRARVRVRQREAGFGELAATDVAACSLLDGPVTCDKGCLARL